MFEVSHYIFTPTGGKKYLHLYISMLYISKPQNKKEFMMSLVETVRSCPIVGRGTCSTLDECMSDDEIAESLSEHGIETDDGAIKWGLRFEGMQLEQALNCRWGEDTDPELVAWNEFQEKVKEHYPNL